MAESARSTETILLMAADPTFAPDLSMRQRINKRINSGRKVSGAISPRSACLSTSLPNLSSNDSPLAFATKSESWATTAKIKIGLPYLMEKLGQ